MSVAFESLQEPILVVGAYGYGNVGDESILAGLRARLGGRRLTVVSRSPQATRELHGVDAVGISAAPSAVLRHRSVIIGGGGLFGRDMGTIGRLLPAFGLAAAAMRRPVLVEGVDLDAALAPSARLLIPALMRRAEHVSVRDRRSVALLRTWGIRADLGPDLSAWMTAAPMPNGRALLRSASVDTGRPVVGLALTGIVPALADQALAAVAGAMDALPDVQFVFLPMSRHPRVATHNDLVLAHRLRRMRPRVKVVEGLRDPALALAAFSQLSAVVAMRYHAMLFAERARVPLVAFPYAEKSARWLNAHGRTAVPVRSADLVAALRDAVLVDERVAASVPGRLQIPAGPHRAPATVAT
jgi:polysaccharide pyruvyl transferase WcaK-like protein